MGREPVVAVIGRPNVGKSTFVNRIIGSRQAIVDDLPGVTRDRSYYDAEWCGQKFQLVDTGGLVPESEDFFENLINQQVQTALLEADILIFLVDGISGITPLDEDVAQKIRRAKKPVILAVNKIDKPEQRAHAAEFHALGLGDPYPLSAMHGTGGVGDLLDRILELIPKEDEEEEVEPSAIRITIAGRPNVGKSSIVNALVGKQRTIVSDIPGTTRDSIDITLKHNEQPFILVDTAGIRKKGKVDYGVELFSVDRSIRSIRESDVVVMVIDVTEGVTDQDKRILQTSIDAGKGLVLVLNKWDLIPNKTAKTADETKKQIYRELPHAQFAPVLFTSAATGQRLTQIYELAKTVYENNHRRIKTHLVNQVIMEAVTLTPPPAFKNRRLKVLYSTQVRTAPPTFVLFVNDVKLMKDSYKRYLEKKMRESFEFTGSPINFVLRNRGEKG
jgi:GTP-binding protein